MICLDVTWIGNLGKSPRTRRDGQERPAGLLQGARQAVIARPMIASDEIRGGFYAPKPKPHRCTLPPIRRKVYFHPWSKANG